MRFLAAILLALMTVQDKPVPQEQTKQSTPTAEQLKQVPSKQAEQKQPIPVVLPEPKLVRVIVPQGQRPVVVIVQPDGERKVLSDDEVRQLLEAGKPKTSSLTTGIVIEDGKVYLNTGGILVPLSGGGASGCFTVTPERNAQIQKEVRLQWEKEKADAEKKK